MRLPKIGTSVVVFWDDIVSHDAWLDAESATAPVVDHDFMESPGRFLGVDDEGRLHLGQTVGFLDGTIVRIGTIYYIPLGAVRAIVPCAFPPNPPRHRQRKVKA